MIKRAVFFLIVFSFILVSACSKQDQAPGSFVMDGPEQERWEIALVEMRIEKNEEFFDVARTPLPEARMVDFEGLNYYFPEPGLRFRTPFLADAGTDTVRLTKRQGQQVPYLKRGTVAFSWEGEPYNLSIFGPANSKHGDYLWLPFYDATSGKDTYAGGRYLDLEIDQDGFVDLDFNYAYNPLCDYNPDKFNCTMPPAENRLPFAVDAGEKTLGPGH